MSAIDDLIAQVEDPTLRKRLGQEAKRLTKEKKFGLVFEDHLPEITPLYGAKVRKNSKVSLRETSPAEIWRVLSISDSVAKCRHSTTGAIESYHLDKLVVVRQFGEPIFLSLIHI